MASNFLLMEEAIFHSSTFLTIVKKTVFIVGASPQLNYLSDSMMIQ